MAWYLFFLCLLLLSGLIYTTFRLRQTQRRAQSQEAKLQLLNQAMSAVRAGLFHYDVAKNSAFWDLQSLNLFGLPTDNNTIPSGVWESIIHPDDLDKCLSVMTNTLQSSDSIFTHAYRIVLPNNVIRWIEGTGYIVRDSKGKPVEISGFHFDITNQVIHEENLKTSELKALQSVEEKANFLANMSHEIRTPLNAISGMIELLSLEVRDKKHLSYLKTLKNSSDLLLRITNDILDISKIDAGKFHLENKPFNLRQQLASCLAPHTISAKNKGIKLIGLIDATLPELIKGDSGRLQQVLMNLLNNAVKFTQTGSIILSITKRDQSVIFSVSDTGIGIEASKQENLFKRFNQADTSTVRIFGGTGLGLAIVKDIVYLWGGDISLESTINIGTKIEFSLPVNDLTLRKAPKFKGTTLLVTVSKEIVQLWNSENSAPSMIWTKTLDDTLTALRENRSITHIVLDELALINRNVDELINLICLNPTLNITVFGSDLSRIKHFTTKVAVNQYLSDPLILNQCWDFDFFSDLKPRPNLNQICWPDYSSKTILCIDDNHINLIVLSGLLRQFGVQAKCVTSGLEAVELVKKYDFDLVILDYEMPNLNGPETAKRMNQIRPLLPIIGLSGHTDPLFEEQALSAGMLGFMSKPIRIEPLAKMLDQYFKETNQLKQIQ